VDEYSMSRRTRVQFAPDPRITGVYVAGALAAAVVAATVDVGGRLLFAGAALILAGYALTDLLFRPRLAVDAAGLQVRSPFARAQLAWPDIEHVRADERLRLGLRSVTLEIDAGAQLIVLTKRALGASPEDVAALVASFDPR
jgi:hypothetical protein